jgi:hypothetical protein
VDHHRLHSPILVHAIRSFRQADEHPSNKQESGVEKINEGWRFLERIIKGRPDFKVPTSKEVAATSFVSAADSGAAV